VSVTTSGLQANGESADPSISADGRFVAFSSDATNLVPGDTDLTTDVFVRDRCNEIDTGHGKGPRSVPRRVRPLARSGLQTENTTLGSQPQLDLAGSDRGGRLKNVRL
jgi:hypothetical protein